MSAILTLDSLPGNTLFSKLHHYLETKADLDRTSHLITPETLPAESQRGETCKLKALADAMEHTSHRFKSNRLPLYKAGTTSLSLRELTKRQGSVVGEVYSIEMLRKTCFDAGYESKIYDPGNTDDYITTLERIVDDNYAPIVFYDMNASEDRFGTPYIGDGSNEHACVVMGYYKDKADETHFIITQWGYYYDFNGMELALSACHSLKNKREVETFVKCYNLHQHVTQWSRADLPLSDIHVKMDVPSRTSLPMKDTATPLKGKIMVVTEPRLQFTSHQEMCLFGTTKIAPSKEDLVCTKIRPFGSAEGNYSYP